MVSVSQKRIAEVTHCAASGRAEIPGRSRDGFDAVYYDGESPSSYFGYPRLVYQGCTRTRDLVVVGIASNIGQFAFIFWSEFFMIDFAFRSHYPS